VKYLEFATLPVLIPEIFWIICKHKSLVFSKLVFSTFARDDSGSIQTENKIYGKCLNLVIIQYISRAKACWGKEGTFVMGCKSYIMYNFCHGGYMMDLALHTGIHLNSERWKSNALLVNMEALPTLWYTLQPKTINVCPWANYRKTPKERCLPKQIDSSCSRHFSWYASDHPISYQTAGTTWTCLTGSILLFCMVPGVFTNYIILT